MKKIYIIIVVVLIISLFVGYAAGRGYKTYEINLEKSNGKNISSTGLLASDPDSKVLDKELVDPNFYAPRILEVTATRDYQSGYNLKLRTSNFKFTPETLNAALEQNAGYAYVSVNGQNIGRVYSPIYHIPESFFNTGTNTISVVLKANNYKTWWSKKGTLEAKYDLEIFK